MQISVSPIEKADPQIPFTRGREVPIADINTTNNRGYCVPKKIKKLTKIIIIKSVSPTEPIIFTPSEFSAGAGPKLFVFLAPGENIKYAIIKKFTIGIKFNNNHQPLRFKSLSRRFSNTRNKIPTIKPEPTENAVGLPDESVI
jgi:hypothetical protein